MQFLIGPILIFTRDRKGMIFYKEEIAWAWWRSFPSWTNTIRLWKHIWFFKVPNIKISNIYYFFEGLYATLLVFCHCCLCSYQCSTYFLGLNHLISINWVCPHPLFLLLISHPVCLSVICFVIFLLHFIQKEKCYALI